jgi:helix-turn-helix protein
MGQVLHGCARTTAAVRRAIQHSQKSLNQLAEQYGINPKTVAKWKKRGFANDSPMGTEGGSLDGSDEGTRSNRCGLS